jgi:hypothetical protein
LFFERWLGVHLATVADDGHPRILRRFAAREVLPGLRARAEKKPLNSNARGYAAAQTGHRIGRALRRSGLRCEGVNVFLADGEAAFQEIFHFHLHVFPRFAGDSFRIDADWATRARHLLDEEAQHVRRGLSALGFSGLG